MKNRPGIWERFALLGVALERNRMPRCRMYRKVCNGLYFLLYAAVLFLLMIPWWGRPEFRNRAWMRGLPSFFCVILAEAIVRSVLPVLFYRVILRKRHRSAYVRELARIWKSPTP